MVSDSTPPPTQSLAVPAAAIQDPARLMAFLAELRLSLDFVFACQAMTRRHLATAHKKRDRWYQQAQFARRAENRILSQQARHHDQGSSQAIARLHAQLEHQDHQADSLANQIQALEQQLDAFEQEASVARPCSALVPPSVVERFTGQVEL